MDYRSHHAHGAPSRAGPSWHPHQPGPSSGAPSLPPYAGHSYAGGPGPNGSGPSSSWHASPPMTPAYHGQPQPRYPGPPLPSPQHSSPRDARNESVRSDGTSQGGEEKRKRIQQACKSCGLKRVKCDGLKPCQTCKRTGELCEYGQPKKRGPPKGSTRGPSKKQRESQGAAAAAAAANGNAKPPRPQFSSSSSTTAASSDGRPLSARNQASFGNEAHPSASHASEVLPPIGDVHRGVARPPAPAAGSPSKEDAPGLFRFRPPRSPEAAAAAATTTGPGRSAYLPPLHPRAPRETLHYLGESSGMGVVTGNPPPFAGSLPLRMRGSGGLGTWKLGDMGSPRSSSVAGFTSPAAFCLSSSATAPSSPAASGSIHSPPSYSTSQWGAASGPGAHDPRSRALPSSSSTGPKGLRSGGQAFPPFHKGIIPWHETYEEPAFADAALATVYRERRRALRQAEEGRKAYDDADGALAAGAAGFRPQSSAGIHPAGSDRSSSPDEMPGVALHEPRVPPSLISKLMNIFWSLVWPHWPILYAPGLGPLGPEQLPVIHEEDHPLLFNAMCALTALAWDGQTGMDEEDNEDGNAATKADPDRRPSSRLAVPRTAAELSTIYFIRARYYLLRCNNESSEETTAALIFMSLHQAGGGRCVQAAQYASTACRMALDLGLHRHLEVSRSHSFTHAEDQARRRLFWGCYVLDKVSAAELGRPPVLRDIETDCPEPDVDEPDEFRPLPPGAWEFFRTGSTEAIRNTPVRPGAFQKSCVELARVVETILAGYNANKAKLDLEGRSEEWHVSTLRIHERLVAWNDRYSSSFLDVDRPENQLPHFLCLAMWYHCSLIILHRPHILKTAEVAGLPPSHAVCTEATRQICRLLAMYERLFAMRKLSSTIVYCIFTASTVSIANTTSDRAEVAAEAKEQLRQFMAWLSQISQTWSTASHHLVILERLGQGIYADLDGTGLEGSGAALAEGNTGGPSRPASRTAVDRAAAINGGGATPSAPPSAGADVGAAATAEGDSQSYRAAANAYWSCMPYGSEDVTQWNLFTTNYLDAFAQLNGGNAANNGGSGVGGGKRFSQGATVGMPGDGHGGGMLPDELAAFGTVRSGDPVRDTAKWNHRPDTLLAALGSK